MRTSRLSRETERIVNALSSCRRTSTRSSLRSYAQNADTANSNATVNEAGHEVDSELSSAPTSPGKEPDASHPSSKLGKRKRHTTTEPTTSTSIPSELRTIRRSSRKAPKLSSEDGTPAQRKPRRQPAKHITGPNDNLTVSPPANWEKVYAATTAMRKRVLAPVDTMGCESLAEDSRSPRDRRLQTLVALMLSSQTKDTVTAAAMKILQAKLPGGFCLESLLTAEPEELNRLIEKVGFHNNKTKFIKAMAVILRDRYGSDIPDTIDGLVSLPGVGPKMAYLCMSAAWGRDEGIGVDVHVHRITNLWGWHKTSTPERTRAELEAWLPKDKWHDINHLLVGFGQTICVPVGRKCGECDLAKLALCPSAVASSPVKKKRVKKEVQIDRENGQVVKAEGVKVEEDDVGVKIEAELESDGNVQIEALAAEDIPVDENAKG